MISISETVTIAAPVAQVWPLLRDPELVASCIPGAALSETGAGGGAYRGTMRVKFGPTVAIFRGEARLAYDDALHRCTIDGRGIDGRGASRALASGVVTASGGATTTLTVEGNFNVTGPLETFANAGGVHLARAILAEFAQNMARLAAERTPAGSESVAAAGSPSGPTLLPAVAPAAELRGGALLWRAFLGWLKQIFFAKGKMG
jgi:carbon monoxide dehydrogenase subunit G